MVSRVAAGLAFRALSDGVDQLGQSLNRSDADAGRDADLLQNARSDFAAAFHQVAGDADHIHKAFVNPSGNCTAIVTQHNHREGTQGWSKKLLAVVLNDSNS